MAFHVGQRVVCVDGDFSRKKLRGETLPIKGVVYTVREAGIHDIYGLPYVRLVEIVNEPQEYRFGVTEACFRASKFRPLDEARLDQFRDHLAPAPKTRVSA